MGFPVVKGVSYVLAHTPDLVEHGSKPRRELDRSPSLREQIRAHVRSFEQVIAYPPNQVFIGCLVPEALREIERPWWRHPRSGGSRFGRFGEIMPQAEFYGLLRLADEFDLVWLESSFLEAAREDLLRHPIVKSYDPVRMGAGRSIAAIQAKIEREAAVALRHDGRLVGCVCRAHDEDPVLAADIMLENLACKATGALAVRWLLETEHSMINAGQVEYVINCGEEASGDRYQRGAGNLAKAMAEMAACLNASGSDLKAYCCAPVHSLIVAASLVQAAVASNVIVVGGGSLAKLGMKFRGHLANDQPVLEDVLAGFAILVGADDGRSPAIRLDAVGKHTVADGGAAQNIARALVSRPLDKLGRKIPDIGKYAVELHNPEITEPGGSGDVPRANYRTIAGLAAMRQEWPRERLDDFEFVHGMPGFSPTQGHVPSAVPYLGHARDAMLRGELTSAMFIGKGSLFLGKMTNLSDGMSFILERADYAHGRDEVSGNAAAPRFP